MRRVSLRPVLLNRKTIQNGYLKALPVLFTCSILMLPFGVFFCSFSLYTFLGKGGKEKKCLKGMYMFCGISKV